MKFFSLIVGVVALFAASSVTACQPPNCDKVDYGSCGNACCTIDVSWDNTVTTKDVTTQLETLLKQKGPDGRYTLEKTAEDPTHAAFGILNKLTLGQVYAIGQAYHTTLKHHYVDTINMVVYPTGSFGKAPRVRFFSTSQIGGALGDAGQNYKNVYPLADALQKHYSSAQSNIDIVYGCGGPLNGMPVPKNGTSMALK